MLHTTPSRLVRSMLPAASALLLVSGSVSAAPLTAGNLVVMLVSSDHPGGAGAVRLAEYTTAGTATGNNIDLASSGPGAVSMSDPTGQHDRHLHRSTDGRYISFVVYGGPAGDNDWAGFGAADAPRTVGLLAADGSVDLSTRLSSSFDYTAVRGAFTTDGQQIWVAGDNASGGTISGGLRYTTRGSNSDVNLSRTQAIQANPTPDNVRDVMVFDGQLYDCSGSSASIGKGVLIVGSGLPTSGAQPLVGPLNGNDNSSVSGFSMIDANSSVPGVDVLYTATSAGLVGIRKYVKRADGTWAPKGYISFGGIEHVVAVPESNGTVTLWGGGAAGLAKFTDSAPTTGNLSGSVASYLIAPPAGFTMGGFDFAPVGGVTPPACPADINIDGVVDGSDFVAFINSFAIGDVNIDGAADVNADLIIDGSDFVAFINAFALGC